jgi:hypothetical protein
MNVSEFYSLMLEKTGLSSDELGDMTLCELNQLVFKTFGKKLKITLTKE